ncbi:NAD(P)(+)--arginine ADP-ribosyltransferase [Daphnia magna]|uniref:NAD(P)(+)--arginine ADP-ribosyltransferase n=1 Tax=Daphnia magna TaxID=35525 RepID=A0A164PAW2_9CRUS|nr:NAD(P)(+)--arginine ADP-ribosyltransferase [Daphnia magna]
MLVTQLNRSEAFPTMALNKMFALLAVLLLNCLLSNTSPIISPQDSQTRYGVNVDIDAYGVERSYEPFYRQPSLYLNVTYDLYEVDPGEQLAAYAYSMSEPEYLYATFNDETSAFRDSSDYNSYYYKGFFGLLLLACQDYDFELYRGVNYTVPAEVNQYIRFNRFLSSSTNLAIAQKYANSSTGQGTIFLIQGTKHANHISPYSVVPEDEEYLISQDAQFFVTAIGDMIFPDGNKAIQITMSSVSYP